MLFVFLLPLILVNKDYYQYSNHQRWIAGRRYVMSRSAGRVARLFAEASISQLWQPGVCQTIARSCPTISYQTMPFSFTLRHTLAAQEPQDEDDAGRRGSRKPNFSIADQIATERLTW